MKEMEAEDIDPSHFTDNMGVETKFEESTGSISRFDPRNKAAFHDRIMKRQKQIDDAAIAVTLKALDAGIPLHGDKVYEDLLDRYPHYQQKSLKRQN